MDEIDQEDGVVARLADHIAKDTPERPYALLPKTQRLEDGWFVMTYGHLANAANVLCEWLDQQLGEDSSEEPSTVAYIGPTDFRYVLLVFACIKTNRAVSISDLLHSSTISIVTH